MLGTRIRELRERVGLTQEGLAEAIGRSGSYISRLEIGDIKKPSAEALVKLAEALHVEREELYRAGGYLPPTEESVQSEARRLIEIAEKQLSSGEMGSLVSILRMFILKRH